MSKGKQHIRDAESAAVRRRSIAELCSFVNGNGFRPSDWKASGLPIIRIQNLNGSRMFNYFDGEPKEDWIVQPGELLYAWAGVKGVSFGPTIWSGPKGVLNQHIYKVIPNECVDRHWLFSALKFVTAKIESNAHGFKSSLVHVHKEDITGQIVEVPTLGEQKAIAEVLRTWDEAIEKLVSISKKLGSPSTALQQHIFERELAGRGDLKRASELFEPVSERARPDLPLLAVMQDQGVVRRDELDRRVTMPDGDTSNYKVVRPGDFVISLRSFEGGLEYSNVLGLVSPAYTVLRPIREVHSDYYRHFFKSRSFIGRLDELIFGIRDGKQIAFRDFGDMRMPNPPLEVQQSAAGILNDAQSQIEINQTRKQYLERQKRGLMQNLLTGQWRVKV
jgi:type I restriction enzyme S subunit